MTISPGLPGAPTSRRGSAPVINIPTGSMDDEFRIVKTHPVVVPTARR